MTDNLARLTLFAKITSRVGVFAWFSYLCLTLYYAFSRPATQQPDAGRLYRLETHGRIAYLTHGESANLHLLLISAIGLILVACVMVLVIKLRERRNAQNQLSP